MVFGSVQLLLILGVCVLIALFSYWLIFGDHSDWSSSPWLALFMTIIGFPACGVAVVVVIFVLWRVLSGMTNTYL